jgi:hypothetical protein
MSQDDETSAFRNFLEHSYLAAVPDSIEKRNPPEPDILCRLTENCQLAFELVEICHPGNAAFVGSVGTVGRLLEESYQNLAGELRDRFDSRFAGKPLSFTFCSGATINRIRGRIGSAEFRNTQFSYSMGDDGVEKFVAPPELYSESSIGSDPLPPGQAWVIAPGSGDENPGGRTVRSLLGSLQKYRWVAPQDEYCIKFEPLQLERRKRDRSKSVGFCGEGVGIQDHIRMLRQLVYSLDHPVIDTAHVCRTDEAGRLLTEFGILDLDAFSCFAFK